MDTIDITQEREQLIASLGAGFSQLAEIGLNDLEPARRVEVARVLQARAADLRFSIALLPSFRLTCYLYTEGAPPHLLFNIVVPTDQTPMVN